jgi:hypothetical protein
MGLHLDGPDPLSPDLEGSWRELFSRASQFQAGTDSLGKGSRIAVEVPALSDDTASMVPPWATTNSRATARPIPDPATCFLQRARQSRSKTWGSSSAGIPGPESPDSATLDDDDGPDSQSRRQSLRFGPATPACGRAVGAEVADVQGVGLYARERRACLRCIGLAVWEPSGSRSTELQVHR